MVYCNSLNVLTIDTLQVFTPGIYTSACDVWSYGVLMYEVYSYGQTPFYGLDDQVTCYNISIKGAHYWLHLMNK